MEVCRFIQNSDSNEFKTEVISSEFCKNFKVPFLNCTCIAASVRLCHQKSEQNQYNNQFFKISSKFVKRVSQFNLFKSKYFQYIFSKRKKWYFGSWLGICLSLCHVLRDFICISRKFSILTDTSILTVMPFFVFDLNFTPVYRKK